MGFCADFNCGYWWKDDDEEYARCHFDGPEGWAPCEVDDASNETEDYDDECGFDPYEGCYTYDC